VKKYVLDTYGQTLFDKTGKLEFSPNSYTLDITADWEKIGLPTLLCTDEEIQQIAVIRQLNAACKEVLDILISEYKRMDQLLKSRKATSGQRKNFFQFFPYLKYYESSVLLMLYTAEHGLQ
jgi:hypothetical protein